MAESKCSPTCTLSDSEMRNGSLNQEDDLYKNELQNFLKEDQIEIKKVIKVFD